MVIQAYSEKLIIENIEFLADESLLEGCLLDSCKYCQYYETIGGIQYDDRQVAINSTIPKNCTDYNKYTPIITESATELINVKFSQFRQQASALILVK